MIKKLFIISSASLVLFATHIGVGHAQMAPIQGGDAPVRLIIPAVGLNANIEQMGLTAAGAMAVPSGATRDVGWYRGGTVPGEVGSAVIDAHFFAAFSKLKYVPVGASVYVITRSNNVLQFTVAARQVSALNQISTNMLFNRADTARLNLITCAGTYVPSMGTYDHRLVLYTVLASKAAFAGTGGAS